MLTGAALTSALAILAPGATRPRVVDMVRATLAQHWQDPLAKKRTVWPRARYNVAGGAEVLYVGDDYLTAAAETAVTAVPTWIVAFARVECSLNAVLDLTSSSVQTALHTNKAELSKNFRASPHGSPPTETQQLGEAAAASGMFDAIYYNSVARSGSHCLALLRSSFIGLSSTLTVVDWRQKVFETFP